MPTAKSRDQLIDDLLAKQEVHEVMLRYARAVNRLDAEGVQACFQPDAWEDHGGYRGPAAPFAEAFRPGVFRGFASMFHHIGNHLIELAGDRAASEAYFVGWHPYSDAGIEKQLLFGGRYLAVFERRGDGPWLIAERTVVHDWSRVDTVEAAWPGSADFWPGEFSTDDLVYKLLNHRRERRAPVGKADGDG